MAERTRQPNAVRLDRVCVVMLAAVGDAVHVLPVLNAIRRHHPSARLSWVLQPGLVPFVEGHPAVDELIPFERARDLSWVFSNRTLPPRPVQHMQDQYLEFLDALGVPRGPLDWALGPWPDERAWQREFLAQFERPIASVVVGTSKPEKDWPAERWAQVCDALWAEHGLHPVLVGGRSARELAAERLIMATARHRPHVALGSGLRRLVAILDGSALVLSPDTGPLHVSVALGRPVISLMGYTNPKRVGPYRRFHDLLIDRYGDPGEDYPAAARHRPGRMERITVADVLEKVGVWERNYREEGRGTREGG